MTGSAAIARAIDASGWEALLADLVRTPSHPGIEEQESAVVGVLAAWLRARDIEVDLREAAPGRPNLLARVGGGARGNRLVLCGHTDTVPLNDGEPGVAFSGEVRDGHLHGRGSVDMKGALAAMAAALAALASTHALPGGEVVLAAVIDEEMQSLGAEALVKGGLRADGAIVGEPTGNRLALGHRGLEWLTIEFSGRAAHGGTPESGINAIVAAGRFLHLVESRLQPALSARAHRLLGPPTINAGRIEGGDQPSTVAAACALVVDRRLVPGETFESIAGELRALLAEVERGMPGLRTELRRTPGGMATFEHVATVLDAAHPLARTVEAARLEVTGRALTPTAFPAWTDAALLSGFAKIPSVVLGPGDLALAHSPRERVSIAEVGEAARIYALSAIAFCDTASLA